MTTSLAPTRHRGGRKAESESAQFPSAAAACCADSVDECSPLDLRRTQIRTGLRLEYLTLAWEIVEAGVAIGASLAAGSVALLGFGVDSLAEIASALILIWRLKAERREHPPAHIEAIDRRARRMVGASLLVLAAYIAFETVKAVAYSVKPAPSVPGIAVTAAALLVMWVLGRSKQRTAGALGSAALLSDAFQATACFWLCLITLAGLALNLTLGWWWADPAAAAAAVYFIAREGRAAWRGEECDCC